MSDDMKVQASNVKPQSEMVAPSEAKEAAIGKMIGHEATILKKNGLQSVSISLINQRSNQHPSDPPSNIPLRGRSLSLLNPSSVKISPTILVRNLEAVHEVKAKQVFKVINNLFLFSGLVTRKFSDLSPQEIEDANEEDVIAIAKGDDGQHEIFGHAKHAEALAKNPPLIPDENGNIITNFVIYAISTAVFNDISKLITLTISNHLTSLEKAKVTKTTHPESMHRVDVVDAKEKTNPKQKQTAKNISKVVSTNPFNKIALAMLHAMHEKSEEVKEREVRKEAEERVVEDVHHHDQKIETEKNGIKKEDLKKRI